MSLRVHTKQSDFLRLRCRFTPRNDTKNETCSKVLRGKIEKNMKTMTLTENVKELIEDIIFSYDEKISNISTLFDTSNQILETKQERDEINTRLQENLAKNECLRKKDFDNIMQDIFSNQDKMAQDTRSLLNIYINEQKEGASTLKKELNDMKDVLARGDSERIKDFQIIFKKILTKQEERKEEISLKLKQFQTEQQEMSKMLQNLLAKKRELRIKDLKLMLKDFKRQYQDRLTIQKQRKEDVNRMLDDFKKEREESAGSWQMVQNKKEQACLFLSQQNIIK